jgi:hypothetical protein
VDPTLAGFLTFIRNVMGITTTVLPDDSPVIQWCYQIALDYVNQGLCIGGSSSPAYPTIYAQAVYNFAGDRLISFAQDQPDADPVNGSDPPMPFFQFSRKQFDINGFVAGVVQSVGDEGTSTSLVVPEAMKGLTFANLQTMKTPWGRAYLAIAQSMGPTVIGIT